MGNEQSGEGQAVPETGLRLSTLCRYQQAEPGVYVCICVSCEEGEKDMNNYRFLCRLYFEWYHVILHSLSLHFEWYKKNMMSYPACPNLLAQPSYL